MKSVDSCLQTVGDNKVFSMTNYLLLQQLQNNQTLRNQNYKLCTLLHRHERVASEYYTQISMQLEKITTQMKLYLKHHPKTQTQEQQSIHNLLQNCILDLLTLDSPPTVQPEPQIPISSDKISQQVLQQVTQQLQEVKLQLEKVQMEKESLKKEKTQVQALYKSLEQMCFKQSEELSRSLSTVREQEKVIKQLSQNHKKMSEEKDEMFDKLKQSKASSNQYGLYLKRQAQQIEQENIRLLTLSHQASLRQRQLQQLLNLKEVQLKIVQDKYQQTSKEVQTLQLTIKQLIDQEERISNIRNQNRKRKFDQCLKQRSNNQPKKAVGSICKKMNSNAVQQKLFTSSSTEHPC